MTGRRDPPRRLPYLLACHAWVHPPDTPHGRGNIARNDHAGHYRRWPDKSKLQDSPLSPHAFLVRKLAANSHFDFSHCPFAEYAPPRRVAPNADTARRSVRGAVIQGAIPPRFPAEFDTTATP